MSAPEPLTMHLELLRAVLKRARAEAFAARELLQLALWLVYRILEIDFRCMEAYRVLAYLFCLFQDWTRACQILLHADRLQPGHAEIQAMLTQIRFTLQHPLPAAPSAIKTSPQSPASQLSPVPTLMPKLDLLRQQFQQEFPLDEELQQRFEALAPVLQSLARSIKNLP